MVKRRRSEGSVEPEGEAKAEEKAAAASGDLPVTTGTVVVGTYDGALLGFGLDDGAQQFGYAPHTGCVKAVHCSQTGRLATGGTDNAIRLFDLVRNVEMGELQEHEDTVSSVQFWGNTTLVTGSGDGQVCIWRSSDWELLLKFRGHKAGVTSLAVHPSGRLMASAGRDSHIRLWDLTRGTSAAHLTADDAIEVLEWSPNGKQIAAMSAKELLLVDVEGGGKVSFRDSSSSGFMRVSLMAVAFLGDDVLALGDGKGDVRIICRSSTGLEEACRLPVDDTPGRGRVKVLLKAGPDKLVIGLSTGIVEVWSFPAKKMVKGKLAASDFQKLKSVDTKSRLTCAAVFVPGQEAAVVPISVPISAAVAQSKQGGKKKKRSS
mmetsp:Transcript_22804/g.40755  ORF Transcript_22804/g.40755 Transcript_22804/m.40755 type:complete len:375 (-) Transcript_22804:37-1161(-)